MHDNGRLYFPAKGNIAYKKDGSWGGAFSDIVRVPFGGVKDSGFGRVRGEAGILEFTQTRNIFIDFSGDKRDPFAMKF